MAKIKSFGTRVYIGATLVGGLKSVELPEVEVTDVDLTTHNSSGNNREFTGGLKDGGTVTISGAYDIADAGQSELRDDDVQGEIRYVTVIFSDGSRVAFDAVVKGYGVSNPLDEDVMFSSSLKITGQVDYGPDYLLLSVSGTTPALNVLHEDGNVAPRREWLNYVDDDNTEQVSWSGGDWVITKRVAGVEVYQATKTSTENSPIGLTAWTIVTGADQPTITAFPAL